MGEVESSAFSPLLRLFFQGKNESQKRVAASAHSSFLFLHSFVSFLRRKRRRKGNSKSNSAFSGTSSLSACGKIYAFFFQRKRKTKRQMTSGAQTSAFPLLFPLFFIFLKSKKKSKKQCKSSLLFPRLFSFSFRVPGLFVCGDFVPSSVRENVRGLFSEGRGEQKEGGNKGIQFPSFSPPLFLLFSFSSTSRPWGLRPASCGEAWFSFRRERGRAKGRWRPGRAFDPFRLRERAFDPFRLRERVFDPSFFFQREMRNQKRVSAAEYSYLPFRHFFIFFFFKPRLFRCFLPFFFLF